MLRHENVSVNTGIMSGAGIFQDGFDHKLSLHRAKEWEPMKITEGDEMKELGFLEPLQSIGHDGIVPLLSFAAGPLIAMKPR